MFIFNFAFFAKKFLKRLCWKYFIPYRHNYFFAAYTVPFGLTGYIYEEVAALAQSYSPSLEMQEDTK